MPTSIREGVEESTKRLRGLEAVAAKYPDAYSGELAKDRFVWISESAQPTDVDLVIGSKGEPWLYAYEVVEGIRVYAPPSHSMYGPVALRMLKEHQPAAYAFLVQHV